MIIDLLITLLIITFIYPLNMTNFNYVNYLLRSLSHLNIFHLIVNLSSLYKLRDLQSQLSNYKLIKIVMILWLLSDLILYLIHLIFPTTKAITIGFSGIILGLILIKHYLISDNLTQEAVTLWFDILPHLFIPNVSYLGHLSGLFAGFIYLKTIPDITPT